MITYKAEVLDVENSNYSIAIQMFRDGTWIAYKRIKGVDDYANPITSFSKIPLKIRERVRLLIGKWHRDLEADSVNWKRRG